MPDIKLLNPESLGKPLGAYSHITRVKASEFLFIAGQVGMSDGKLAGDGSFEAQCAQAAGRQALDPELFAEPEVAGERVAARVERRVADDADSRSPHAKFSRSSGGRSRTRIET